MLRWLSAGKTDRDIGAILDISRRTVHKHLQRIYDKLGVETRNRRGGARPPGVDERLRYSHDIGMDRPALALPAPAARHSAEGRRAERRNQPLPRPDRPLRRAARRLARGARAAGPPRRGAGGVRRRAPSLSGSRRSAQVLHPVVDRPLDIVRIRMFRFHRRIFFLAKAAPAPSALSFATATSRAIGAMPQFVHG